MAKVPGRVIAVGEGILPGGGEAGSSQRSFLARVMNEHAFLHYALPVGGGLLLAFAMGIWLGTGSPGSGALARAGGVAGRGLRTLGEAASRGVASAGKAVLPARVWRRLSAGAEQGRRLGEGLLGRLLVAMPARAKTWWCVRCISSEKDAARLCQVLRRFACDHLNMEANAPLQTIVRRIAEERPQVDSKSLNSLFRELDDAAYGGQRIELSNWKRAFRRRFRHILANPRQDQVGDRDMGLPKLNP